LKFELAMNKELAGIIKVFILAVFLIYLAAAVITLVKG